MPELPPNTIFINSSGLEADRIYNEYCDKHGLEKLVGQLISHNYEYVMQQSVNFLQNYYKGDIQYKVKKKKKSFVCFNKFPRIHRLELLDKMMTTGLYNHGYYSFEGNNPGWENQVLESDVYPDNIKELVRNTPFPIRLDGGIRSDRTNPIYIEEGDLVYHNESYFSIVTETLFYQTYEPKFRMALLGNLDGVFLSEKTYRPILLKHPFILFAMPNSLTELRKAGYKTFAPYINEDYDSITDGNKRFKALFAEIERLCGFTDSQWIEWQRNIQPIVEHNYKTLLSKTDYAIKDYGHFFVK